MVRFLALAFLSMFSFQLFGGTVTAPGKFFYVGEDGVLTKKEAALILPERGEGDISLVMGENTYTTKHFFSTKYSNRVVFTIVFCPEHNLIDQKWYVMTGSYMRGSNKAVYYGDTFVFEKHDDAEAIMGALGRNESTEMLLHKGVHKGGFKFSAEVPTQETPPSE